MTHLLSCFDAVYRGLGESAPLFTSDANVVRAHEMSRSFGAVALRLREHLDDAAVEPLAIITQVLSEALADDESGSLTLYAMALVVGPRLLVSLRDAREVPGADDVRALLDYASKVTVSEVLSIGEVAQDERIMEDPRWQARARALMTEVEKAGNAESFGISR
ncbi:MAG: hypothetical protein WA786_09050 [Acidimicrobiales bacterium]